MARTPNRKRQALWRGRVSHQSLSGLSVAQFCAEERSRDVGVLQVEAPLEPPGLLG